MTGISHQVLELGSIALLLLLPSMCAVALARILATRRASVPSHPKSPLLRRDSALAPDERPLAACVTRPVPRLKPSTSSRRYCLITPCRDEARYARRTLDAVTRQTEPPALWVIVDDGSRDDTPRILAEYAVRFPYIRIVRRPDRGVRKVGGGVIDAFYSGYEAIDPSAFQYVCKLDLDLDLPPTYFERVMDWMEACPRIGTCSGKPYFVPAAAADDLVSFPLTPDGGLISEKCGDENSVGMIKFYRTTCFRQIGGFVREVMWDGIDGHRCRQEGWIAVSSDEPELRFVHLRPMGTSHRSWWTGRARHGYGQYFMGTSLVYMLASALYRMTRPPVLVGGLAILCGYLRSMWRRLPRYGGPEFRSFLRRYQWACLLRGKARATADLDALMEVRWSPARVVARPLLGEILVRTRALTAEKLEQALAAQRGEHAGAPLGQILVRMRALTEEQVQRALDHQRQLAAA